MKKIFLLSFAIFFSAEIIFAGQIHIGTGQLFRNIQAAASTVKPGDTLLLHEGSYDGYQGISELHGNSSGWVTFRPYQNDAIDIAGMWQFMKCSYLRFENLTFKANAKNKSRLLIIDNGGSCVTQSHHIVIDSCSFTNVTDATNSALKFAGVDTFEVKNSLFKDIAAGAMDYNSCHAGLISNNRIENTQTGGHIKGGASDITMERNFFLNAATTGWVAFELGGDTGTPYYCPGSTAEVLRLKFYSNIIKGGYRGLALSSAVDCEVINNTFYETNQATLRILTTSNTFPAVSGNRIENNIFAFGAASQYINGSQQSADAAAFLSNIYYSTVSPNFAGPYWDIPQLAAIKEQNPIIVGSATAMFVDPANNDFHLDTNSPAIASGRVQTAPTLDFYGKEFRAKRSIGAVEFGSQEPSAVDDPEEYFSFTVSPNPTKGIFSLNCTEENFSVEIFNSLGEKIYSGKENFVDISSQPAGAYFVRVKFSSEEKFLQVVKE